MRWEGNRQSDNVEDRRSAGGGFRGGRSIGIGTIIVALIGWGVFGINPHASEGTLFGLEDQNVVLPAMARLRAANEPVATGDMRTDLVARLQRVLAYAEVPSVMPLVGTCLAEEQKTPELLHLFRERSVAPRRDAVRGILVTARERGELPEDLDIEPVIDLLMGSYQARYLAGGPFPDRWAERVVDTVLNGVLARG